MSSNKTVETINIKKNQVRKFAALGVSVPGFYRITRWKNSEGQDRSNVEPLSIERKRSEKK